MLTYKITSAACILLAVLAPAAAITSIVKLGPGVDFGAEQSPPVADPIVKAKKPGDDKINRAGPLKDLPSAAGPHIAKIAALGDDSWLQLSPKPDPQWGAARGRTWGNRAFAYAPDIEGAYFLGEGVHAYVKPDGHAMDDVWVYDINADRWIAVYPGTNPTTFNQRVRDKEILVDKDGLLVTKEGEPIPIHSNIHAWDLVTYDTDAHKLAYLGDPTLSTYILAGGELMAEGVKSIHAQRGDKNLRTSPWFYDSAKGKFELDIVSTEIPNRIAETFPFFLYVKSRKQFFLGGQRGVCWYDPAKRSWSEKETDTGPRPQTYDYGGCYDEKRDHIYMGRGAEEAGTHLYRYDIAKKTWTQLASKGTAPTRISAAYYDVANDVITVFGYRSKKIFTYVPSTDTWSDRPFPESQSLAIGEANSAFYDPKLNAYFCYFAGDSENNGTMWAYRYKNAKPAKDGAKPDKNK